LKTLAITENPKLGDITHKTRLNQHQAQFVLLETNAGRSSTKSLINHLNSKLRIHVILESEDQKTIRAQEEIRSQIVKKK